MGGTPVGRAEPLVYVKLLKELYGLLRLSLLFYKKPRKDVEDTSFAPMGPLLMSKIRLKISFVENVEFD